MKAWLLPIISVLAVIWKIAAVAMGKPMTKTEDFFWLAIAACWMLLTGFYYSRWQAPK